MEFKKIYNLKYNLHITELCASNEHMYIKKCEFVKIYSTYKKKRLLFQE